MHDELVEISHRLLVAIRSRDRAALDAILADDFTHLDTSGAAIGRDAFVSGVVEAPYTILSLGFEALEVTRVDDVAVVVGVQTAEVETADGERVTARGGFTDLFTRAGGAWVIRLAHSVDL